MGGLGMPELIIIILVVGGILGWSLSLKLKPEQRIRVGRIILAVGIILIAFGCYRLAAVNSQTGNNADLLGLSLLGFGLTAAVAGAVVILYALFGRRTT